MGDEDDRRDFIDSNIVVLGKSTVIGTELVIHLMEKGLVDDEEKDILLNCGFPNIKRAALLYTTIASKWSETQFKDFKTVLKDTGNLLPLQVFANAGAELFLTNDQVQLLREQRDKSRNGCFEGVSLEDEMVANKIVQLARDGGMFGEDGKFELSVELERKQVISLVRRFVETLRTGVIWWNPRKPQLPFNYIPRRVARTNAFGPDGKLPWNVGSQNMIELTENKLVLLVDPPGQGKSSQITFFEQTLRTQVARDRIVLRVNLNEVQRVLGSLSKIESATSVILKFAPFLPSQSLQITGVSMFLLLDGLDEVCPKHHLTMINILRIFSSSEETVCGNLRVVVTTRPHLRNAMESAFNLKSWSLLPLTEEEQDNYIQSVLNVSGEQLRGIRCKLTLAVDNLLGNPLMLSMFVDVLRCELSFSGAVNDVNIFDLYTRFVESKHRIQLVQKEGMKEEDNFTDMRLESLLERNLSHYHLVAVKELIDKDYNDSENLIQKCRGNFTGVFPQEEEPSGVTRDELLSIGLLIEGRKNQLVFKHRSFAEFFYARLLLDTFSLPQVARDLLFGNIYRGGDHVLYNVEAFVVAAASSSASLANIPPRRDSGSPTRSNLLLLPLTSKWILIEEDLKKSCEMLQSLVFSSKLFPLLAREVLLSFVHGDPTDLWQVHQVLLHAENRDAFAKLHLWMSDNRTWTRRELFNLSEESCSVICGTNNYSQQVARLMTVIALRFENQQLVSEEEVGVAVNSFNFGLVNIVASLSTDKGRNVNKWDIVESNLSGGRNQLRNLFMKSDSQDFSIIIKDQETVWKLVSIFSYEEIYALVTNEETRMSDILGRWPREVMVALGNQFVPHPTQLATFRGKFGSDKGKTLFEMGDGGFDFALKYLWGDLILMAREVMIVESDGGNVSNISSNRGCGALSWALKEALGRMGETDSWTLIEALDREIRRRRSCPRQLLLQQEDDCLMKKKNRKDSFLDVRTQCNHYQVGVKILDWVTKDLQQWNPITTPTSTSLDSFPFFLRYTPSINQTLLRNILLHHKKMTQIKSVSHLLALLRSLAISSFGTYDDQESCCFSFLVSFLRENINEYPESLRPVADVFFRATKEEVKANATSLLHLSASKSLVSDVSVGGVFLRLLSQQQKPTNNVKRDTWILVVRDVIQFTPCCDLPGVLQHLRIYPGENLLKDVLTSGDVFSEWQERFWSIYRREWEEFDSCGLTHLLSFYFSIFGVNLSWMKMQDGGTVREAVRWKLVKRLPVEIANVFVAAPYWIHLLPQFQEMLREFLRKRNINSVGEVARWFPYEKQHEWESLLILISGNQLLPPHPHENFNYKDTPSASVAAPLVRALIKLYGLEWTKQRLTQLLWNKIPSEVRYLDGSLTSLGWLLHSAIELGEVEEVQRRSWPGVLLWRNSQGKNALEVAKDKLEEMHPISLYLQKLDLHMR